MASAYCPNKGTVKNRWSSDISCDGHSQAARTTSSIPLTIPSPNRIARDWAGPSERAYLKRTIQSPVLLIQQCIEAGAPSLKKCKFFDALHARTIVAKSSVGQPCPQQCLLQILLHIPWPTQPLANHVKKPKKGRGRGCCESCQ